MLYRYRNLIKYLPTIKIREDPKPLGRWSTHCYTSSNIRSALANLDSCGDRLCGDPLEAKRAIAYERHHDVAKKQTK